MQLQSASWVIQTLLPMTELSDKTQAVSQQLHPLPPKPFVEPLVMLSQQTDCFGNQVQTTLQTPAQQEPS